MIAKPTRTYTSLDAAYGHFNRKLFKGQLPPCLITMQRHKGDLRLLLRQPLRQPGHSRR